MKDKITRVSLGAAIERDLTDWKRLRSLTDEEIESAIANDPDAEPGSTASVQGLIFLDAEGAWRWRPITRDGEAIADSPTGYADRSEVDRAIKALRDAIMADSVKAA